LRGLIPVRFLLNDLGEKKFYYFLAGFMWKFRIDSHSPTQTALIGIGGGKI
jgi:hypothetical protein